MGNKTEGVLREEAALECIQIRPWDAVPPFSLSMDDTREECILQGLYTLLPTFYQAVTLFTKKCGKQSK